MDIESAAVVVDGKNWERDLPELGDLEVLVAAWENPAFERAVQKGIRSLPPALRADGSIDPPSYYRIVGKAMARTILFGWRNFKRGGAEVPFDATYAESLLVDPKLRPFRDGIVAASKRVQLGLKVEDEAIEGNSSASSHGSASGEASPTS